MEDEEEFYLILADSFLAWLMSTTLGIVPVKED